MVSRVCGVEGVNLWGRKGKERKGGEEGKKEGIGRESNDSII
jgi:hypothetical protein